MFILAKLVKYTYIHIHFRKNIHMQFIYKPFIKKGAL